LTASHCGEGEIHIGTTSPSKTFSLSLLVRSVAAERGRAVAEYAGLVAKHTGHATEYASVVGSFTSGGTGRGAFRFRWSGSNGAEEERVTEESDLEGSEVK
jgi:hypothetical protein